MVKQDDEPCRICGRGTPRLRKYRCECCSQHFCSDHKDLLQFVPDYGNLCRMCIKKVLYIQ